LIHPIRPCHLSALFSLRSKIYFLQYGEQWDKYKENNFYVVIYLCYVRFVMTYMYAKKAFKKMYSSCCRLYRHTSIRCSNFHVKDLFILVCVMLIAVLSSLPTVAFVAWLQNESVVGRGTLGYSWHVPETDMLIKFCFRSSVPALSHRKVTSYTEESIFRRRVDQVTFTRIASFCFLTLSLL
jgi:hypothetical protein